jgi:hypothetical protein
MSLSGEDVAAGGAANGRAGPTDYALAAFFPAAFSKPAGADCLHHETSLRHSNHSGWLGLLARRRIPRPRSGYAYFSGHPIIHWPPLYPLYLSAWVALFAPTGVVLIIANAILIAIQAFLWLCLALLLTDRGQPPSRLALSAATLYIGFFVPFPQSSVLAHNQLYVFLPLLLTVVWLSIRRREGLWPLYFGASFCCRLSAHP